MIKKIRLILLIPIFIGFNAQSDTVTCTSVGVSISGQPYCAFVCVKNSTDTWDCFNVS